MDVRCLGRLPRRPPIINRLTRGRLQAFPAWLRRAVTFLLVALGWVMFRATDWPMALSIYQALAGLRPGSLPVGSGALLCLLLLAASLAHFGRNSFEIKHEWRPASVAALTVLFAGCLAALYVGHPSPFLYFQF